MGTATDIHDLTLAREALERHRNELERRVAEATAERNEIWRLSPDLLGVSDQEGRLLSANPAWRAILGYEPEEVVTMGPYPLAHPDDLALVRETHKSMAEKGASFRELEIRNQTRDGDWRWIAWAATTRDGLTYLVGRDVTERKAAAERLRETQEALSQTQKLETIGQLTGGVAHDFNNLLAAILSNLDMARKRLADDDAVLRLVEGAIQGAERGAALTQRLLAFVRRQELKAQTIDVAALIGGMRELLSRSLGPAIRIELDLPAGLPAAEADPNQLELALLNLAVNARDAMPDGGTLTVSARVEDLARGNRDGLAAGRYVAVAVADTGQGMDERTLKRAVEPFFTTKGVGQGTGLGLSMVQGLAAQSGGGFRLESRLGEGSRATLLLPLASGAAAQAPDRPQSHPERGRPLKVLVVDDDALVALGNAAMLEDLGHEVIEASSGAQALEALDAHPDIDVVITDQAMPGMTGAELARRIHDRQPHLPVILASGGVDLEARAAETGLALRRLSKPFRQADMARALAEAASEPAG